VIWWIFAVTMYQLLGVEALQAAVVLSMLFGPSRDELLVTG